MNYKNKNVLIIGFGSIGQRHAKILVDMSVNVFVYSRRKIDFKSSFSCLEKSLEKINYDYVIIANKTSEKDIDESSDTYDTIDWLVNNVENNNGNVGIWGISYPGFYSTYATVDAHPALKAASPQASIGDFFFDDFHHNGAYLLSYFRATSLFGTN